MNNYYNTRKFIHTTFRCPLDIREYQEAWKIMSSQREQQGKMKSNYTWNEYILYG